MTQRTWKARIKPEVSEVAAFRRRGGLTFTRSWLELDEVPEEVLDDPRIEVREIPASENPPKKEPPKKKPPATEPPAKSAAKKPAQ